ncbi:MAG: prolyl oligopeptidase family serine peptidase, partial [Muribaculaceae bacterium]
ENELYPGMYEYKYPKAGETNATVSVLSYDVENRTLKSMKVPMEPTDYVAKIVYGKSPERLMVTKLNRHQNEISLYAVNPRSTVAKLVYSEKSDTWINHQLLTQAVYYDDFFVIRSEKSGWAHLYQYANSGALMKQITKGEWNVTEYYGYNPTTRTFYFQTSQVSPLDRTIAKVDAKGIETPIVSGAGTYSATFSANMAYYIQNFCDAKTPNQYKVINTLTGKTVRNLELNEAYAEKYTGAAVPKREFFQFDSHGYKLNGYMIKPLDFNANKKYPVIMSQYSGPGSQMVRNNWKVDWEEYFATQGYIVVCVDGRGTGCRGKEFESSVYMKIGQLETIDQIAAANYMASQPYVDAKKIGIWGWSFGGYEVLMAMSQADSPYAAGVAIAPVTDWRFYDTIYTERFMRTPRENESGYDQGSPLKRVAQQKGRLLIMAGTADDNVHITNTYQYAAQMTQQNKLFDMMVYLNMNHSINGCETRVPLYARVLEFFNNNLKK